MSSPTDSQLWILLALAGSALGATVVAIVRLVRSGRSVPFPNLELRPRADIRSARRDHVSIR